MAESKTTTTRITTVPRIRGRNFRYRKRYKYSIPRQVASLNNSVHTFVRGYLGTNLDTTTTNFAYEYTLGSVLNPTEFSALFDLYRIKKAVITFIPLQNNAETEVEMGPIYTTSTIPTLWITDDHDGSGPTTANEFLERGIKPISLKKPYSHTCYPRIAKTVYNTPTSAYAMGKRNVWVNMADTSVPHYGTYCLLEDATAGSYWKCRVYVQLFFQCKGIR